MESPLGAGSRSCPACRQAGTWGSTQMCVVLRPWPLPPPRPAPRCVGGHWTCGGGATGQDSGEAEQVGQLAEAVTPVGTTSVPRPVRGAAQAFAESAGSFGAVLVACGCEAAADRGARSAAEGDGVPGGAARLDGCVDLDPDPVDRGEQCPVLLPGRRVDVRVDVEQ